MKRLLFWLTGYLPCRIIAERERKYLERYYLFSAFGIRCYLHRFVGSDPDRGFHDHPWRWAVSLILAGGYWEHTRIGVRRVRWINVLNFNTFHRVVIQPGATSWSLFFHSAPALKRWGFWRDEPGGIYTHSDGVTIAIPPTAGWEAFVYEDNSPRSGEWWKRVPKGRDEPRRQPEPRA